MGRRGILPPFPEKYTLKKPSLRGIIFTKKPLKFHGFFFVVVVFVFVKDIFQKMLPNCRVERIKKFGG